MRAARRSVSTTHWPPSSSNTSRITRRRRVGPEDTLSLIYTSGTTGPPKGVTYSHNNVVWTMEACRRLLSSEGDVLISYLPLAHVAERFTSQWNGIYLGREVYFCPDPN